MENCTAGLSLLGPEGDSLPGDVDLVAASASQGGCSGTGTVTCDLGDLANGASAQVTIRVRPRNAGVLTNHVEASAGEQDPDASNNRASENTTVTSAIAPQLDQRGPKISVSKITRRCRTKFRFRFTITDESPLQRVAVFLDRRRIRSTTRSRFTVQVKRGRRVRAGRHRLRVVATDSAGNTAARIVRFRICRGR